MGDSFLEISGIYSCDKCRAEYDMLYHFSEYDYDGTLTFKFQPDFDRGLYCQTCIIEMSKFYKSLGLDYPAIPLHYSQEPSLSSDRLNGVE